MKVYVFTYHLAVDGEYLGTVNRVFSQRKDAIKFFDEWKKEELDYVATNGWTICSDLEDHFEACVDGYYCSNHTEGFVNEYDVE